MAIGVCILGALLRCGFWTALATCQSAGMATYQLSTEGIGLTAISNQSTSLKWQQN
jgi:hypothetical protein